MNNYFSPRPPPQLQVERCDRCVFHKVGRTSHPCNKCYSMDSNCHQQYFKSAEKADTKPLLHPPVNDIDLLTMQVDALVYENAELQRNMASLRGDFNRLADELVHVIHEQRQKQRMQQMDHKMSEERYKQQKDQLQKAFGEGNIGYGNYDIFRKKNMP